jgi:hypothetical protein
MVTRILDQIEREANELEALLVIANAGDVEQAELELACCDLLALKTGRELRDVVVRNLERRVA